jgi:protein-S-isoprenylcysteine O-methyltransferase Ste14
MWFVAKRLPSPGFAFAGQGALAGLVLAVGLAIGFKGVLAFRRHATTANPMSPDTASRVVTTGIFGMTRNPMYLGLALVLVAWTIFLGSLSAGLGVPVFLAYMTAFQVVPEERILRNKFGAPYDEYCHRVRRWI